MLRESAPQVLGALVRRYGDFDLCEDAVQEALLAAALQWPVDGVPANPKGWLITVAFRRRTEMWRNESARRRREELAAATAAVEPESEPVPDVDDTLKLLLLCCHPALTPVSQVALTLRAVGGLSTAEIARALLVPDKTVGQRISRAKQLIRTSGAEFRMPPETERSERMASVLHVLYLIFNEGSTASSGSALHRVELSSEAIRLTRQVHDLLPDDGEVAGLLALMLLDRRPAPGSNPSGRRPGPARGTGPQRLGRHGHRGRRRPCHEDAGECAGRAVSAAGGDRGRARRGSPLRGHRLAPDPWPVWAAGDGRAGADGDAQSDRRGRDGPWSGHRP